jgi:hypothetical protein
MLNCLLINYLISNSHGGDHLSDVGPHVYLRPIQIDFVLPPEHALLVEIEKHANDLVEQRPGRMRAFERRLPKHYLTAI